MGRAITIASFLVLCSFAFVFYQLWIRRPAVAAPPRGPAQILEAREDGSVFAVSAEIERLEKRLADEEKRWVKLQADLEVMRKERAEQQKTIEDLQGDVRRLRRQLNERTAPAARPPVTPPTTGTPTGPETPDNEGSATPGTPLR